ncbi:MAG: malonyl-CoA decarboxylase domain-containing protein [Curvibacter sp.]|jgi:malonyl-CoA decarboxylase
MMAASWIGRQVARLLPDARPGRVAAEVAAPVTGATTEAKGAAQHERPTRERLAASLRHKSEAMSPRMLRRTLDELKAIIDPQISEVEGGRRARELIARYARATLARRRDVWLLMSEMFTADPEKMKVAQAHFAVAVGTPDEAAAEVQYRRATVSPRRRLLQRFSVLPEGIRFLVDLRGEMQPYLKKDKRLLALDVEMEYMFSTWFDVGFLELRRISWDSPASLVEKLIKYEAVHDIRGWEDVKNRLDSDRRCYGFFHPRLPDEPLIFVEVALGDSMAASITPLLDERAAASDLERASWAIFYSISNTQPGLRGVSFGDSLIKPVVETLGQEFARLRHFSTLSPIPGLRKWLGQSVARLLELTPEAQRLELGRALGVESPGAAHVLQALDYVATLDTRAPLRRWLLQCAAHYLGRELDQGRPLDPVARFHLGNGARVERLNWMGDPSPKGLQQSYGLMVNYLYDLKRLDRHRAQLQEGTIPAASVIEELQFRA